MTMHEPIRTDGATDAPDSNQLALLANIGDMVAGRDRAIELYGDLYDQFHAARNAAAKASIGGNLHFSGTGGDRYSDPGMTPFLMATGATQRWEGTNRIHSDARTDWMSEVTKRVDRACWTNLMSTLGFDQLLDRQAREEFQASLTDTPPAFTVDNCSATFGTIWLNRRDMYLRGIANVFMQMDRRFRSHDAFGLGNRLIISYALSDGGSYWTNGAKRDTLNDVERIFRELDNNPLTPAEAEPGKRPAPLMQISDHVIAARRAGARYVDEYFKIDAFQNGNVHIWFTNKRLLAEVNALLLEYYKPVEGDVTEGASYEAGPLYHQTPAKNYGFFPSPAPVVQAVIDRAAWLHARNGCVGRARDEWKPLRVLEPSAGTGAIAKAVRALGHRVECVEIQAGLAHQLRRDGFEVTERDFLSMTPNPIYDAVLMNPPFDRGRDCDHVRHAFQFLKPGGVLVAVMSARAEQATDARHKALHDLIAQQDRYEGRAWQDLPERSFAESGTNVNTVTLRLVKRS